MYVIHLLENKSLEGKYSKRFTQLITNLDGKINLLIELWIEKVNFKERLIILYDEEKEYLVLKIPIIYFILYMIAIKIQWNSKRI